MFNFIKIQVKQSIKRQLTIIIMILIMFISIQMAIQENRMSINQDNNHLLGEVYQRTNMPEFILKNPDTLNKMDNITINSFKLIEEIGFKMEKALEREDFQEFNRLCTFGKILTAKYYASQQNQLVQKSFKRNILSIWEEVSGDIDYDEIIFNIEKDSSLLSSYYGYLAESYFYHNLYKNKIFPIDYNYIDSGTFSYKYFEKILPYFIWIVITLIFSDTINRDIKEGTIKLLLNNMFSRKKYLFLKAISNFISSLIILLLPMILINLFLLIKNGLTNFKYPVLFLKGGLNSFNIIPNFLEYDKSILGTNLKIGISNFSRIPKGEAGISSSLGFISIYKMILLSIIILLFVVLFYSLLNILISILVNNQINSLLVTSGIIIISKYLTKHHIYNENLNFSPFNMDNPIRILSGTYNSNFLIAIISLFLASCVIYIISMCLFNKKDL